MKKIFSIFGMVLVSLALHATVETKDITWTLTDGGNTFNLAAWGSLATKWGWTEGCGEYDQLVFEFDNPAGDIMVSVNFNNGGYVPASAALHAGSNSLAIDVKADVLQSVDVKNYSSSAQTIKLTRMYLRRAVGPKQTETLWSGTMDFSDWKDWEGRLVIAPEKFAGIHAGDLIQLEYSVSGSYQQLNLISPYNSYKMAFPGVLDGGNYNINSEANPSELTFAILSEDDITNLQTQGGLSINAVHITLTAVKLIKHEVLWTGEKALGEWTNAFDIPASKLSDIQVGNILCFRVSAIGTEASPRVTLAYGDSWNSFDPTIEYYFQGEDQVPMTVEFPVTYKMMQQLKGNKLVVRGVNYTVTDIYVKEGTPVNKVAAYLSVTSAGMATFIVPFNVPSLPEGVQAYTLTNDGSNVILATEVNALTADQPVLIVADEDEYEFISEEGASDDVSEKTGTYTNGALIGTYVGINPIPVSEGVVNNYVLQNGSEGVAFYQVTAANCSIPAYRAYLSCGYNANSGGANHAPRMRIVFQKGGTTGIENQMVNGKSSNRKLIKDGHLYIMREEEIYTIHGQHIK